MADKAFKWQAESGQVISIQYACWTRAGADPYGRTKQNQDAFVVKEDLGGKSTCLFGVFDGHGADGAKVSKHLVDTLPRMLANSPSFQAQQYREMFEKQMPLCNKKLMSVPGIRTELSGSTAIAALLQDSGLLTVANVGDSRCILGKIKANQLETMALNTEHTPEVPDEAARILARKGRIRPYIFDGEEVGPMRIWLGYRDSPGLSMTRAFGDELGASVGVIAVPEITQVMLGPEDRYLVLCSDGLFEFMDNDYIMSIIHHQACGGWSPSDIAKCLVAEAARQWMEEEDGIIDDCTVIVALMDNACVKTEPTSQPMLSKEKASSVAKTLGEYAKKATSLMSHMDVAQKTKSIAKDIAT